MGWEPQRIQQPRPAHCTAGDCMRPVRARGLCATHYQEARRTGTLKRMETPRTCLVSWCPDPATSRGLCHAHYQKWLYRVRRGLKVESAAELGAEKLYKCKVCGRPLVSHSIMDRCG